MKIAICAALPEEYRPLQESTGPWTLLGREPFRKMFRMCAGKEILIVETGMGPKIKEALSWIMDTESPDLILSIGFAGSLHSGLGVGQVFIGERFTSMDPGSGELAEKEYYSKTSKDLIRLCNDHGVGRGRVITAHRPQPKSIFRSSSGALSSILDMETYFVASFAFERKVPFLCFRAISDALEDEIDFDLDMIADAEGRVRIRKVLIATLRTPRLLRSFYSSWKRSRKAAKRLAEFLTVFLNLRASEAHQLLEENSLYVELKERGRAEAEKGNSAK